MRTFRKLFYSQKSFERYLSDQKKFFADVLYMIVMSPLEESKIREILLHELPIGRWCFIKNPVYGGEIELVIFVNDGGEYMEDVGCLHKETSANNFVGKDLFVQRLSLEILKEDEELSVVIVVDIDDFKSVNNAIGYVGGDVVLHIITCRLTAILPERSFATRLYGDKYVIFIQNTTTKKVDVWLKKLLRVVSIPITYGDHEFYVTASAGVYCLDKEILKVDEALRRADIAMSWAKRRGRNCIAFYENGMLTYESEKLQKSSALVKMCKNKDFSLVYQPILCLHSNIVSGFEVLMRCKNIQNEKLCMQDIVTMMEEMGIIYEVGNWVMKEAFQQISVWNRSGNKQYFVSINVSAIQIQNARFLEDLQDIICKTGIKNDKIFLEITETSMLSDLNFSARLIDNLKKLDINVSIDDFGTGYSSLNYLKNLKAEVLKVDRSFVKDIDENYADLAIVRAIVSLGHHLGMKVIAEGVETEKQVHLLKEIGCDYIQGFYIAPPLTVEEVQQFVL